MPLNFRVDSPTIGFSAAAAKEGDSVSIITRDFASSDDGKKFIKMVEGMTGFLIDHTSTGVVILPSQIHTLLAIIDRDNNVTLYINEAEMQMSVSVRHNTIKGQAIQKDDITDIISVEYTGIEIQPDCGFVSVFPIGWKRGIFYDMQPLLKNENGEFSNRGFNLSRAFASLINSANYDYLFDLSEDGWDFLFSKGWFLFNGLKHRQLEAISQHSEARQEFEQDIISQISIDIKDRISNLLESWRGIMQLSDHIEIIERAIERYAADDYISTSSIIFPRIEGILRSFHIKTKTSPISQKSLSGAIIDRHLIEHQQSLLLPEKFQEYLTNVYFASFDPLNPSGVSRNTVSHGVASSKDLNLKSATIGILTLEQIINYILGEKILRPQIDAIIEDGIS